MEGWVKETCPPGSCCGFDPLKRKAKKVEEDCSENAWTNSSPDCNINKFPLCRTSSNSCNIVSNEEIQCLCVSGKGPSTCDRCTQHSNFMCKKNTQHKSIPCDKTTQYSNIKFNKITQDNGIFCNKTTQYNNIMCNKRICDICTTFNISMENYPSTECERLSSKNTDCIATCSKSTRHDTMCDKSENNQPTFKTSMKPSSPCKATRDCTTYNKAAKQSGGSVLIKHNIMKKKPCS